jgi:hypothetical protein
MKIVGIIPARMAASRFPGKPVTLLAGPPMIEHVYRYLMGLSSLLVPGLEECHGRVGRDLPRPQFAQAVSGHHAPAARVTGDYGRPFPSAVIPPEKGADLASVTDYGKQVADIGSAFTITPTGI